MNKTILFFFYHVLLHFCLKISLSIFRSGTGAKKGRNFVFTALSPEKTGQPADQNVEDSASVTNNPKTKKTTSNPAKKQKIDRSISSDSRATIFNFL